MQRRSVFLLSVLGCLLFASSVAQEKKIHKKEVPAAVLSAFEKAYPNAKAVGFSTEVEHGTTFYEVESVDGKTKRDLLYKADGSVEEIEETVAAADLPEAVSKALQKEYPKGKIAKVQKVTHGANVGYEIQVVSGKKKHGISIDSQGNVAKPDKEKMEKKNEEKED